MTDPRIEAAVDAVIKSRAWRDGIWGDGAIGGFDYSTKEKKRHVIRDHEAEARVGETVILFETDDYEEYEREYRRTCIRREVSAALAAADAADPLAKIEGVLWCVTVAGPDEVHAVQDYATGVRKSRELNEWLERNNKPDENAPIIFALIDEWPWDAESHSKDLVRQEKEEAAIAARREKKRIDALGGQDG
ncbi:MAG: hypothetical protein LKI03_05980 [Acetobacter indonesiensis]|jgi:hypothetical protein|nr:hypothetical protein [Acetobacter indonesiensis]MCI1546133.1 hypothetical protein [Acetobacter indonesiensis]MCI1765579.1 hypothetical protein [Acetobacter indonesiensis]